MHKYFNFAKIYEAEQTGKELLPADLGTQEAPEKLEVPEDKLEDFAALAKDYLIEVFLTESDLTTLSSGESVTKKDAQWKLKTGNTIEDIKPIAEVIFNTSNEKTESDKDALLFALGDPRTSTKEGIANRIINAFKQVDTGELLEVLTGTAQDGTVIPEITVKFLRSPDISAVPNEAPVKPASSTDIESGAVPPPPTSESISPKKIMSFNQFVNEDKKQLTKSKSTKEDNKLKKKSKKSEKFPDLSGDGKVTKKDILIAKGVIKK